MEKYCPECKKNKSIKLFGNNRARPDGKSCYCKSCTRNKGKTRRKQEDYPDKQRYFFMQWKYGITQVEFEELLQKQDSVCAICKVHSHSVERPGITRSGKKNRGLVIDHDHGSHIIRGLLCDRCNRAVGLLRDDDKILQRAAEYIRSNGTNYIPIKHRKTLESTSL